MLRSSLGLSLLLLLGTTVVLPAHAQSLPEPGTEVSASGNDAATAPGIVMLVRRPQHIRAALQTVQDLRASDTLSTTPVEIVVCGKAVRTIQAGTPLATTIAQSPTEGVRVLACGMSLSNLNVDPNTLASEVTVVPNGLAHALKRQAEGYLSVDL